MSLIADALVNLAVIKYRLGLVPAAVARRHLELAVRGAQRANSPFVEAEGHTEHEESAEEEEGKEPELDRSAAEQRG